MKILFNSSLGESQDDPDEAFLRDLCEQPEAYWQDPLGSGTGALSILDAERAIGDTLEITRKDPHGFFLLLHANYREFVVVKDSPTSEVVKCHYAGEPFFIPVALLHPPELAFEVMKEFCRSGQPANCVKWVRRKELSWDSESETWNPPADLSK